MLGRLAFAAPPSAPASLSFPRPPNHLSFPVAASHLSAVAASRRSACATHHPSSATSCPFSILSSAKERGTPLLDSARTTPINQGVCSIALGSRGMSITSCSSDVTPPCATPAPPISPSQWSWGGLKLHSWTALRIVRVHCSSHLVNGAFLCHYFSSKKSSKNTNGLA